MKFLFDFMKNELITAGKTINHLHSPCVTRLCFFVPFLRGCSLTSTVQSGYFYPLTE